MSIGAILLYRIIFINGNSLLKYAKKNSNILGGYHVTVYHVTPIDRRIPSPAELGRRC